MAAKTLASVRIDMSADSAKIVKGVNQANRSLKTLEATATGMASSFRLLAAAYAAFEAASAATSIVRIAAEYETLNASLETVYGSQVAASKAFEDLQKFAGATPFTLSEITEASIRMKSLGLDPSTEALRSMGNTAAAMGKPLMQFVEAVADATTNEFERLKEFGIKSSQQGDRVEFTFQGMTTTVRKNAQEIQDYLLDLGNVQFAGGIERQADTLSGRFAQLSDSFSNLANTIVQDSGLADYLKYLSESWSMTFTSMEDAIRKSTIQEQLESSRESLDRLNNELKEMSQTVEVMRGIEIPSVSYGNKIKEIEATKSLIEELEKENQKRLEGLEIAKKKDEQQRAAAEMEAAKKAAVEDKAIEDKRLKELFGGDPSSVLARIEEQFLSEEQLIQDNKIRQLALLENFRNEDLISEENYRKNVYNVTKKANDDIAKLEKDKNKDIVSDREKFYSQLLTATTGGSRALFNIQKAARVAEAIVEGYASAVSAYRFGNSIGGPPVGAAFAATSLAFTGAKINAIKSASFGGGSASGGSGGGSASTPDVAAVDELATDNTEATQKTVTINIEGDGDLLPRSVIRRIADELNETEEANVRIVI